MAAAAAAVVGLCETLLLVADYVGVVAVETVAADDVVAVGVAVDVDVAAAVADVAAAAAADVAAAAADVVAAAAVEDQRTSLSLTIRRSIMKP